MTRGGPKDARGTETALRSTPAIRRIAEWAQKNRNVIMLITSAHGERHRNLRKQGCPPGALKILGDVKAQTIGRRGQRIRPGEIGDSAIRVRHPCPDRDLIPRLQLARDCTRTPDAGRPSDVSRTCVLSVLMRLP